MGGKPAIRRGPYPGRSRSHIARPSSANFVPDLNLGMHLADAIAAGKPADIVGTKPFSGTDETKRKQMGGTSLPTRRRKRRLEAVMNHSMHSADRATHLKIVVMALVAGIAIAGFAI